MDFFLELKKIYSNIWLLPGDCLWKFWFWNLNTHTQNFLCRKPYQTPKDISCFPYIKNGGRNFQAPKDIQFCPEGLDGVIILNIHGNFVFFFPNLGKKLALLERCFYGFGWRAFKKILLHYVWYLIFLKF